MKYLLVDPFNQGTSGVTTYCQLARARLRALGWEVDILSRGANEALDDFRRRLAREMQPRHDGAPGIDMVEAPETLAVTSEVQDASRIHIRLHGSRHFGAWLQGLPSDVAEQEAEQAEVMRARVVSAPSAAAVATHRLHFGKVNAVRVYPNPAPATGMPSSEQVPDFDFLFLGRWQTLKGAHFFEALAHSMRDSRFAVACLQRPAALPTTMVHLPVSTPEQRVNALKRSAAVVIPSLFETASMVGLEALAAGKPVVTWSHLGIVEYAPFPCIHAAEPWSQAALERSARTAVRKTSNCDFSSAVQSINSEFDRALSAISGPEPRPWRSVRAGHPPPDHPQIFRSLSMMQSTLSSTVFQRKLRKLIRDPNAYWHDSVVRRTLVSMTRRAPGAADAIEVAPASSASDPATVQTKVPTVHQLGGVPMQGFVKLKAPAKSPQGWRVCLVHAHDAEEQSRDLLERLHAFDDFGPFRRDRMNVLPFDIDPNEAIPNLIGRFDQKNKEALAQLDHLLLLDVPPNLASALHHCAPNLRSIAIFTQTSEGTTSSASPPDSEQADALVCYEGSVSEHAVGWARKVVVPGPEQLPVALLRVLRETGPKERDMLLQVTGSPGYRPELHEFNRSRYQGLIRLRPGRLPDAASMREFIHGLASEIEEMYVLESVYMRYRTLVEEVESGALPDRLIEACLRDGVLFDVS